MNMAGTGCYRPKQESYTKVEPAEDLYVGSKIIKGVEMDECSFLRIFKHEDVSNRETRQGYKVTYPDGYVSWSPKHTFETAYRRITVDEFDLLIGITKLKSSS